MNQKTILLVEDEEGQRLALKKALEFRGFHVEAAGTGGRSTCLGRRLGERRSTYSFCTLIWRIPRTAK